MGTIKDRNGMDLTKAEDIKKRCQEYTVDYTKNIFITQIATLVVTHLEPDMPRMQSQVGVVWTELVEVMEFQLSYFKS